MLRVNELLRGGIERTDSNFEVLDRCVGIYNGGDFPQEKANNILKIRGVTIESIKLFVENVYPKTNDQKMIMTYLLKNVLNEQVKYKEKKEILKSSLDEVRRHEKLLFDLVVVLRNKGALIDGPAKNVGTYKIGKDSIYIKDQPTPLMIAIKKGLFDTADFLIENSADIHSVAKYKSVDGTDIVTTALLSAVQKGEFRLVTKLICLKVDLEVQDQNGNTALNLAIIKGFTEIAQLLLDNKAEIETKNGKNHTPFANACIYRCSEALEMLGKRGADLKSKPRNWSFLSLKSAKTTSDSAAQIFATLQKLDKLYSSTK